jgi:hypothetical protein
MRFCFSCIDKIIPKDMVLNDSISDISEEVEGSKTDEFYSDSEVEECDYEKHILKLNLQTIYENTETVTIIFITTVGYSIFLVLIYNLFKI